MNFAIITESLSKSFNDFTAVDNISFKVKRGEVFGFLGPNGAGKTTTINMLVTLLKPTSGTALVNGFNVSNQKNEVRNNIGVVFQTPALDDKLTGQENLNFHSMLYGLNKQSREKRINEVLKLVDLTDKADVLVEKYSGGMKRRLEIARGLIHKPKVLFLDEPTLGLDAQTRRRIWDYIKQLNRKEKITIMLTTHYMEEADYLCNRVAIIDKGRIIISGSPSSLKNKLGGDVITLELTGAIDKFINNCIKEKWIKKIKQHDNFVNITATNGDKRIPRLISLASGSKVIVKSVNLRKPSLEDVFLHHTGRTIREQEASVTERFMMRRPMHGRH
ncbi:MAG: ATP-binding cassette domain-containing protein [Candidatus Nanoarchaeia archaeon]|jgi:ABC-2 type transport system ATP-binding protein